MSTCERYPLNHREDILKHLDEYGDDNYQVPPGIINRLKAIAQSLDNKNYSTRKKISEWSPDILSMLQSIFSKHSPQIKALKKVSLTFDANETIHVQCPICLRRIMAQRPSIQNKRFELIVNHILTEHYPGAANDVARWKQARARKIQQKTPQATTTSAPTAQSSMQIFDHQSRDIFASTSSQAQSSTPTQQQHPRNNHESPPNPTTVPSIENIQSPANDSVGRQNENGKRRRGRPKKIIP